MAVNCSEVPTITEEDAGETATETSEGATPVPLSETTCGLEVAVSIIVRVPARDPAAAGVNVTEMVQLAPAARVWAQLFVAA